MGMRGRGTPDPQLRHNHTQQKALSLNVFDILPPRDTTEDCVTPNYKIWAESGTYTLPGEKIGRFTFGIEALVRKMM